MSLAVTLANALSGLSVSQKALSVTAHNISNANTEGYTRKEVSQETQIVAGRGAGARTAAVTREVDAFLTREMRVQASRHARAEVTDRTHGRIQDLVFGAPGDDAGSLGRMVGELGAALEAFATTPERIAQGAGVVAAATELAQKLGRDTATIQSLRGDADAEIGALVRSINADVAALHELNLTFQREGATADLLDRRDQLLQSLAGKIDISTAAQENDTIAVYASGVPLLEYTPRVVHYAPAATVVQGSAFGAIAVYGRDQIDPDTGQPIAGETGVELVSGGVRATLTPELLADGVADADQRITSLVTGGRLAGLLETRDVILPELDDQIQELGALLRHGLNAAHNRGVPHPLPSSLEGTRTDTSAFAAAPRSGTAYLAVVDRSDGSTVSTIAIDVTVADPAALAAQIDADLGGLGTATIGASGNLEIALASGTHGIAIDEGDSAIPITDAAGRTRDYGFFHYFGLNDLLVSTGSLPSDLAVRADIRDDPSRLTAVRLDVQAGPPPASVAGGAGDNRAALDLSAAMTTELDVLARGGLPSGRTTMAGYAADIVAHSAAEAAGASTRLEREQILLDELALRSGEISGVNLDEELSKLALYQQTYVVSARLISITDELFDRLMEIGQ